MFYSARHSEALVKLYAETFGAQVPEATGRKAARAGRMQDLMAALDDATDTGKPMDFNAFAQQLPAIFEGKQVPSA